MRAGFSKGVIIPLSAALLAAGFLRAGEKSDDAAGAAAQFRALISAEKLEKAIGTLMVDQMLADFAAGTRGFPECGWHVDFLQKDSKLIELGVEAGSVLESRAGVRLLAHPTHSVAAHGKSLESPGELVWVTPNNERRSAAVPAGKLGYQLHGFVNLPNWYLRHGRRDPKWDRQVVAALLQLGRDPGLAEACWAEAFKRGYRSDRLSTCSGMMLALSNGELSRAEAFAKDLVPFDVSSKVGDFPTRPIDVFRLGFLTGNPEWLMNVGDSFLNDAYDSTLLESFRHQVELAKNTPAGTPPPSELAKGMKRRSFLRSFDTTPEKWAKVPSPFKMLHHRAAVAAGAENQEFPPVILQAWVNHYFKYDISPQNPSPNIDVEVRFRAEAEPSPPDKVVAYLRCFRFGLADRDKGRDKGAPMNEIILMSRLSFGTNDSGEVPVWEVLFNGKKRGSECGIWPASGRKMSPLFVPTHAPFPYTPETIHTLRIVRVGGQAEALLDGRRLALVHVPAELRNPALILSGCGCKLHITALRADLLE